MLANCKLKVKRIRSQKIRYALSWNCAC